LVFSQWSDALALLREALTVNAVGSLVLTGGVGAVQTLKQFRESGGATAAAAAALPASLLADGATDIDGGTTMDVDESSSSSSSSSSGSGSGSDSGTSAASLVAAAAAAHPIQVLLMPLRATNAGLSISEASHVILLDTGLNSQAEVQALARVRRLNSTTATTVHRFVMRGTVEEAIWQLLGKRQRPNKGGGEGGGSGGGASKDDDDDDGNDGDGDGDNDDGEGGGSGREVRRSDLYAMLQRLRKLYPPRADGGLIAATATATATATGFATTITTAAPRPGVSLQPNRPPWRECLANGLRA
jgi:hypothetical protein